MATVSLDWTELAAIRYRLERPELIPGKSHYAVYRNDIHRLLEILEGVIKNG